MQTLCKKQTITPEGTMKKSSLFKLNRSALFAMLYTEDPTRKGEQKMDRTYSLNDLAEMTGFTTRTLRNYLNQGLLKGEKQNGVWQFTAENIDLFFREPFVKEGLRIKHSSLVFDFMAERNKKEARTCMVLDLPASLGKANAISAFFCEKMDAAEDARFTFDFDGKLCRVILTGSAGSVAEILKAYYIADFQA
jgi:hypothetical protein